MIRIWIVSLLCAIAFLLSLSLAFLRHTGSLLGDLGSWLSVVSVLLTAYTLVSVQRLSRSMTSLVVVRGLRKRIKYSKGRLGSALQRQDWPKIRVELMRMESLVRELAERVEGVQARDAEKLLEALQNATQEGDASRGYDRAATILRLIYSLETALEASEADSLWSKHV